MFIALYSHDGNRCCLCGERFVAGESTTERFATREYSALEERFTGVVTVKYHTDCMDGVYSH